ncbi:MAG: hypothetical protein GF403_06650 [Candidatus Coatesbacteria bacterium]|nr:hypothetical protein [Candidatus Coatesbacteria bacterium]
MLDQRVARLGEHLVELVNAQLVELDSIVYSDGWKAYNKLSLNGFHHRRINHQDQSSPTERAISTASRTSGATPNAASKPITVGSNATSGYLSGKGRSDLTTETMKTRSTTCRMHCSIGPIRLHDALNC